jgi:phospholipid transport system substrate-binding protein
MALAARRRLGCFVRGNLKEDSMDFAQLRLGRRGALGVMILVLGLTAGVPEARAQANQQSEDAVRRLVTGIIKILSDRLDTQEELKELGQVIDKEADLDALGQLSLGRYWRQLSDQQKLEYRDLFRQLMLRKFAGYLNAYAGQDLGAPDKLFKVTGSREVSGGDFLVESQILPPSAPPLAVTWRVRNRGSRALIIDVIVEQASLLITQRNEFGAVIAQRGIDGFLADLRNRVQSA